MPLLLSFDYFYLNFIVSDCSDFFDNYCIIAVKCCNHCYSVFGLREWVIFNKILQSLNAVLAFFDRISLFCIHILLSPLLVLLTWVYLGVETGSFTYLSLFTVASRLKYGSNFIGLFLQYLSRDDLNWLMVVALTTSLGRAFQLFCNILLIKEMFRVQLKGKSKGLQTLS